MKRLFTAIEIPDKVASSLSLLQGGLVGARWITPENFHLTLCFIGEVAEDVAHEIERALSTIRKPAFSLALSGVGEFGQKKPRALWAGIEQNSDLQNLQATQARLLMRLGVEQSRNYTPHITLARLRDMKPAPVWRYIEANNLFRSEPFRVERFVLYSSRLSQGGGPYRIEQIYPLDPATTL